MDVDDSPSFNRKNIESWLKGIRPASPTPPSTTSQPYLTMQDLRPENAMLRRRVSDLEHYCWKLERERRYLEQDYFNLKLKYTELDSARLDALTRAEFMEELLPRFSISFPKALGTSSANGTIPLDEYKEANFPDVKYWHASSWREHMKSKKESAATASKEKEESALLFIEDKYGNFVGVDRVKSITQMARINWNSMVAAGDPPETWGCATTHQQLEFTQEMEKNFSELRLCAGHWKIRQLATQNYPSWIKVRKDRLGLVSKTRKRARDENGASASGSKKKARQDILQDSLQINRGDAVDNKDKILGISKSSADKPSSVIVDRDIDKPQQGVSTGLPPRLLQANTANTSTSSAALAGSSLSANQINQTSSISINQIGTLTTTTGPNIINCTSALPESTPCALLPCAMLPPNVLSGTTAVGPAISADKASPPNAIARDAPVVSFQRPLNHAATSSSAPLTNVVKTPATESASYGSKAAVSAPVAGQSMPLSVIAMKYLNARDSTSESAMTRAVGNLQPGVVERDTRKGDISSGVCDQNLSHNTDPLVKRETISATLTAAIPAAISVTEKTNEPGGTQMLAGPALAALAPTTVASKAKKPAPCGPNETLGPKNLCCRDWCSQNPGGSRADFESHWKAIAGTPEELCYITASNAARKAARTAKKAAKKESCVPN